MQTGQDNWRLWFVYCYCCVHWFPNALKPNTEKMFDEICVLCKNADDVEANIFMINQLKSCCEVGCRACQNQTPLGGEMRTEKSDRSQEERGQDQRQERGTKKRIKRD